MKSRAEQLDEMSKAILIATDRICYYKQQDKMLQSEIKRLTRNERTHRLCTRGGMIEAFIQEPEKLSDDQVMELLTVAFRQPAVSDLLQNMLEEAKANPFVNRCFALSEGSCRGLDGEKEFSPSQGTLHFPCAAARLPYCAHDRKERL